MTTSDCASTDRLETGRRALNSLGLLFCLHLAALPIPGHCEEDAWHAYNRSLSALTLASSQQYTEYDANGLTDDGILDTEKGAIPGWGFQARWQGRLGNLPLWAQVAYERTSGRTDYDGYLQSGGTLTPYTARTGNVMTGLGLRVGVPFAIASDAAQLIPYAELASNRWQRDLVGYREHYSYQARSLGLLAQWQIARDWTLEVDGSLGKQYNAKVSAPDLGFTASFSGNGYRQFGLAAVYRYSPKLSLEGYWRYRRYDNDASAIIDGLQEPPSHTRQSSLGLAATWHY